MLKKISMSLVLVLVLCGAVLAQPEVGSVAGVAMLSDGNPAVGATITLAGVDGGHHGHHPFFRGVADAAGAFSFPEVPAGPYSCSAGLPMAGFANEMIRVIADQTTNVTLTLRGGHEHGDSTHHDSTHHRPDSLVEVDLEGTAIVLPADSLHRQPAYLLDVDGDGAGDYRLVFGPPWYNPSSGAARPANGDEITIHGGLFTYGEPPMVVVFEINGLFWRDPRRGHGGHGGGDHGREGCNPDSVTRVEFTGIAHVATCQGPHRTHVCFAVETDAEHVGPEYFLDFGGPDYDPGNGATRPADGDEVEIVGGQIFCPNAPVPMVIVYEINGQFWREPGDTLTMGAMNPDAVTEPVYVGSPVSYLTARNFPNPFNPVTTINYSIPTSGNVAVTVFDVTGRAVAELVDNYQAAGNYAVSFDGSTLSSGIYFYRVSVGNLTFTNRMVLMK